MVHSPQSMFYADLLLHVDIVESVILLLDTMEGLPAVNDLQQGFFPQKIVQPHV